MRRLHVEAGAGVCAQRQEAVQASEEEARCGRGHRGGRLGQAGARLPRAAAHRSPPSPMRGRSAPSPRPSGNRRRGRRPTRRRQRPSRSRRGSPDGSAVRPAVRTSAPNASCDEPFRPRCVLPTTNTSGPLAAIAATKTFVPAGASGSGGCSAAPVRGSRNCRPAGPAVTSTPDASVSRTTRSVTAWKRRIDRARGREAGDPLRARDEEAAVPVADRRRERTRCARGLREPGTGRGRDDDRAQTRQRCARGGGEKDEHGERSGRGVPHRAEDPTRL